MLEYPGFLMIGRAIWIRTLGFYYHGVIAEVESTKAGLFVRLNNATIVYDTGHYPTFLATGRAKVGIRLNDEDSKSLWIPIALGATRESTHGSAAYEITCPFRHEVLTVSAGPHDKTKRGEQKGE